MQQPTSTQEAGLNTQAHTAGIAESGNGTKLPTSMDDVALGVQVVKRHQDLVDKAAHHRQWDASVVVQPGGTAVEGGMVASGDGG